ncbi:MAG: glycine--tRNA ligase [Candidatus Rokubacteria bacterium]|nr:glycine--tRNA ligase [Candidatus Rokubacteria bacterium]
MVDMDTLVSLCKRRGFVYPSSEIYGGLGSSWDYGPLGVELKRNIRALWWRDVVQRRRDVVGLESAVLMNPRVWETSGHLERFTDPLVDCRACKRRFRADQLDDQPWTHYCPAKKDTKFQIPRGEPCAHCGARRTLCPECGKGDLTEPRQFNLMLKTFLGPVEDAAAVTYLRPETAQGMFVNFDNVLQAMRRKLPFGIAQVGKSFRNEITPGNFIFRTREFEQMELEFFVNPHDTVNGQPADEYWHERWIEERLAWYERYGLHRENLRLREHAKEELAHYAKRTVDIEYRFPMGWNELEGIANRTDYDLKQHAAASGKALTYYDDERKTHVVPYVIEPAAGVDRSLLAFLVDAYQTEEVRGEKRVVLRLSPELAPIKVAVLPLLKKREEIVALAGELRDRLAACWMTVYDDTAAIGRLYRRQDEVGTPYCVTVDVQTVGDPGRGEVGDRRVTIRDRDSMEQVRVPIGELEDACAALLGGTPWAVVAERYPRQPGA